MKCTRFTRACLAPDLWHIPALCSLPATSPYRPLASSLCLSPPRSHSLPRSVSLTLSSPLRLSLSLLFCATLFLGSNPNLQSHKPLPLSVFWQASGRDFTAFIQSIAVTSLLCSSQQNCKHFLRSLSPALFFSPPCNPSLCRSLFSLSSPSWCICLCLRAAASHIGATV